MTNTPHTTSVVLVADEDAELRSRLRAALEAENLTVIEAADSENCLLMCNHLRPDLVLLSSNLTDALQLCQTLKTAPDLAQIRILVTLTADEDALMEPYLQVDVDDCLPKPLRFPLVLRHTKCLLEQQALEREVEFQREILSQMADAVVGVDVNSNVIYWNPAAERIYGITSEAILGSPLSDAYVIDGFTPEERNYVVTTAAEEGWRGEGTHITRDGKRIEVEVTVRPLEDKVNLTFGHISVIRDIGERKQIEAALREQRELAEALRDTISALTRTLDPQGVMRLILDQLGRVVPNKCANIMLIEGDKARVGFSRGYSAEFEADLTTMTLAPYELPTFQRMLATGQPFLIADTMNDPAWTKMAGWEWVKSYLGTPISAYDHVIGFLNVDSDTVNAFTPIHADRMRVFADQAAIAIENAQLYDAIYRDAVEMRTLQKATAFLYGSNLFTSENLVEVCEQVVRVMVREFGKLDSGVLLVEEGSDTIVRVARAGAFHVHALQPLHRRGSGLIPAAIRTNKTICAPDVTSDSRYIDSNPETRSELVIPLRTNRGVIGVLDLQSAEVDAFNEHDVRLMELFADRAATAIENVKLYNQIRRYAEELEERVRERTGELNRVKDRVEAILNHSSDAILLVRANGAIQQSNHAFDIMFGYGADEAFSQPLTLLVEPQYQKALTEAFERVLEKNNPERLEIIARRLNGLTFDADVTLSPVSSEGQDVTSIVCSLRDISARKRLETELRESLYKERELNELKSRFIARASHEFRTPLAVILTSSDLLKNYSSRMSQEQRDEKLNRLQREVRNIALMLDDLLTLSKGEELKEFNPELVDLQSLTRDVAREVGEGFDNQHGLLVECAGNCTSIYADRKLILRIITNLLSNAIKYSPVGSTIEVNISCEINRIVLTVQDQGIGIPEGDQARLFEAFHRARNVEHIAGTGLGLAIVKQAVDLHGGEVFVSSQLGSGSIFTVILPNLAVREKLQ